MSQGETDGEMRYVCVLLVSSSQEGVCLRTTTSEDPPVPVVGQSLRSCPCDPWSISTNHGAEHHLHCDWLWRSIPLPVCLAMYVYTCMGDVCARAGS